MAEAVSKPVQEKKKNEVWQRLKRNKLAMIGMVIVIINIFMAVFAPFLTKYDPNAMDYGNAFVEPAIFEIFNSSDKTAGEGGAVLEQAKNDHWFGTDNFGRDLFARVLYGSRVSLIVGIASIAIGGTIGTVLGLIAAFYGGKIDNVIMRIMDGLFAFPFVLLSIALMTVLGTGMQNIIIVVSVVNIPGFTRIARGSALTVKELDFVVAARALGEKNSRLIFNHIFPNCMASLIVYATMSVAGAILSEAALSFLGLGIKPPDPSWGGILKAGQEYLQVAPHMCIFAGVAILVTVLGFNLFGDGLRDALDPKMKD